MARNYWRLVEKAAKEWETSVKKNKEINITPSDHKAAKIAKKLRIYE